MYLVKWKDYPKSFNSWEPYNNLKAAWDLIEEYEKKIRRSKKAKKLIKLKESNSSTSSLSENSNNNIDEPDVDDDKKCIIEDDIKTEEESKISSDSEMTSSFRNNKEKIKKKFESIYQNLLHTIDDESYSLPSHVLKIDVKLNGKLNVLVRYKNKETKSIDYDDFKKLYPQIVLDLFESRIVFPFENSGTRKFHALHKRSPSD